MHTTSEQQPISGSSEQPLDQVIDDINLWIATLDQPVWIAGHGTASDNPNDFFEHGLEIKNNDLSSSTIPVETSDPGSLRAQLDNWPHHQSPNVVLLGAQRPHNTEKLGKAHEGLKSLWMDGLIQEGPSKFIKPGRDGYFVPTEWVLGVYNSTSGNVTLNPHFSGREVTKGDMESSAGERISSLHVGLGGLAMRDTGASDDALHQILTAPNDSDTVSGVW